MKILLLFVFIAFTSGKNIERISQLKCQDYNEAIKKNNICNGTSEFPFLAGVGYENKDKTNDIKWACSGVLISNQYVLTSAICVSYPEKSLKKYVSLGSTNLKTSPQSHLVSEIKYLPDYVHGKNNINDKNIALLKLEKPVEFSQSVQPICLYSGENPKKLNVAGYFIRKPRQEGEVEGAIIQDPSVLYDQEDCRKKYEEHIHEDINFEKHLCTMDGPNTCGYKTSSGSPLLIQDEKFECMRNVVGITDLGPTSCNNFPVLNLKISGFIDWLEKNVW